MSLSLPISGSLIFSSKSFDCYLMSMLSHYFHLAFFTWSNIMAYDLFKTFTVLSSSKNSKNFITNNEDKRIQFFKYSLVGWLFPLTIVTVLLFFQFLFNQMVYGFKTCFISSQLNLLLFFVLPVCVLLCLNLFFLISSIKSIRGVDKLSKKYLKKDEDLSSNLISNTTQTTSTIINKNTSESNKIKEQNEKNHRQTEKNRLILFIKLIILFGMTWVFGLLVSFKEDSFVWFIYIILNSLQGFFIFMAYAFTPQTKKNVTRSRVYKGLSTLLRKKRSSFDNQDSLEIKNITKPYDTRQSI